MWYYSHFDIKDFCKIQNCFKLNHDKNGYPSILFLSNFELNGCVYNETVDKVGRS